MFNGKIKRSSLFNKVIRIKRNKLFDTNFFYWKYKGNSFIIKANLRYTRMFVIKFLIASTIYQDFET